jgi:hypothetical protein
MAQTERPSYTFTYRSDGPLTFTAGCCASGVVTVTQDVDEFDNAYLKVSLVHDEACQFWKFIPSTGDAG